MIYTKEMIKKQNEKIIKSRRIRGIIFTPIMMLVVIAFCYVGYHKIVLHENDIGFLGLKQYVIMTGSMEPEYEIGDLIMVHKVSESKIDIDDVITYSVEGEGTVTHRVAGIINKNGQNYYQTKGDNNNAMDGDLIPYSQVQGKVFLRLPQFGTAINRFVTGMGSVVIFMLVLISYTKSVHEEEKKIAREEARKKYNVYKYQKGKVTNDSI